MSFGNRWAGGNVGKLHQGWAINLLNQLSIALRPTGEPEAYPSCHRSKAT